MKFTLKPGQTIAVVGLSAKPDRPSFDVARAMQRAGFAIRPVNPQYAGASILGEHCVAALADLVTPIDIVNCFRRSEEMLEIAIQATAVQPRPKMLWMQVGVKNAEARRIAEAANIEVVEDHCIKIEYYASL